MILFLDFDRVLFDNEKFYNAIERDFLLGSSLVVLDELSEFLYVDTISFLTERRAVGDELVLVTRGEEDKQRVKADKTGVIPLFEALLYVPPEGHKSDVIAEYHRGRKGEAGVFIDDTISELERVREHCPEVRVVRMRRPTARNSGQEAPEFEEVTSLSALYALL